MGKEGPPQISMGRSPDVDIENNLNEMAKKWSIEKGEKELKKLRKVAEQFGVKLVMNDKGQDQCNSEEEKEDGEEEVGKNKKGKEEEAEK